MTNTVASTATAVTIGKGDWSATERSTAWDLHSRHIAIAYPLSALARPDWTSLDGSSLRMDVLSLCLRCGLIGEESLIVNRRAREGGMGKLRNRNFAHVQERMAAASTDQSPVALIGSSAHGAITSWNRAASSLLGWRFVDVVDRRLIDVLGCDVVSRSRDCSGVTRVRAHVASASGLKLEVDVIVEGGASHSLTSTECVVALVPVPARSSSLDAGSGPAIDSWSHAAEIIKGIGGVVQCVSMGLVGVEAINRGYSRSTGDAVLREIAGRIEVEVGRRGRVLRIGGNQFAVVAPADGELDAALLVERVSQPVQTRLGRVRIGGYAGLSIGDSGSGLVLLDRADASMRRAQSRGIGSIECLTVDGHQIGPRHSRLNSLLIDAIARREITVAFQPVVELATGRIIEFEALARWKSKEIGDVDPAEFIEAAEDAGLIHDLGQIVLERSLDVVRAEVRARRWGSYRVSVSVSAVQLTHPDLPTRVLEALSSRQLEGGVLQLELTETRQVPDIAFASAQLCELRKHGVRIAIDDFGTGCANMSYLRDLPVDAVKIDGRFVAGMCSSRSDTAVIRSIVSLAADLQIDVIANGVETADQHLALTRVGCSVGQGTLYSSDRQANHLFDAVTLPERRQSSAFPYPADETRRLAALHSADILDTPAEDVYDDIVRAAADLCGTPVSLVSLIDEDRQWFKAKVGIDADETSRDVAFCAHAICSDALMEVPDARYDDRFASNPLVIDDPSVRFYAGAPLRAAAGYSYGTLCVIDTVPRVLSAEQRRGLSRLARQVTVLLELRESVNHLSHAYGELELAHHERDEVEARLRYQAHHDALTALPNRALLMERIETAFATSRATGQLVAMLICDLDDFKLVNDGLGHPAGDQLLIEIAHRLRSCVRDNDTVARFGGDEFVVLVNNADQDLVVKLATRILHEMAVPMTIGGRHDFRPAISIGVAFLTPGITGDELLSNADAAMYQAKSMGGGQMCLFDAAVRADVVDRLTITTDLRTAVTNDELFCLHQPEIDLLTGDLFGLESLVRWQHPTRGILLPDQFVPILEASNGTGALFERVLHLTLAAQARWAAGLGHRPAVAVNLSARQLHDADLVDTICTALALFQAPPESLWLEVTETALASGSPLDTLQEIQRTGVHLAIDDFGVGWSSMARLSSFPWDLLKIDRSFISPLGHTDNAQHVVGGIISLAHSMGMRTSAEGVETMEQLHRLRDFGCDIVQGYLIDRPLPASEASERMSMLAGPDETSARIGWNAPSGPSAHGALNAFNSSS